MDQDEQWLAEGQAHFAAGRLADAEQVLRRIGVSSFLCRDALLLLGRVLLAAGQRAEALHCVIEADGLERDGRSQLHVGECLFATRDLPGAEAAFRLSAKLDAALAEPLVSLGRLYAVQRRWPLATEAYDAALTRDPRLVPVRFALAEALVAQGDLVRARAEAARVLAVEPGHAGALALAEAIAPKPEPVAPPVPVAPPAPSAPRSAPTAPLKSRTPPVLRPPSVGGTGVLKNLQEKLRETLNERPPEP